jgi:hypothetical protein
MNRTLGRTACNLVLTATASAALLFGAAGSASAGTLDQQQTDGSGGNSAIFTGQSDAQTFTAGLSGGVDQVDLQLQAPSPPLAPLSVEIRNVSGGAPGDMVLASQSVPGSSVPGSPAFVAINFATPAPVVAGTQYAIVAYSSTDITNDYGWAYGATDAYAGGEGLYTLTSPPSGAWNPLSAMADLAFKTYVVVPTLGPTAPTSGPAGPTSGPTGQRAAALKKCKKRAHKHHWSHKRLRKCKKKANLLPV